MVCGSDQNCKMPLTIISQYFKNVFFWGMQLPHSSTPDPALSCTNPSRSDPVWAIPREIISLFSGFGEGKVQGKEEMSAKQENKKGHQIRQENRESQRAEGTPDIGRTPQEKGDKAGEGPWKAEHCLIFLTACLGFPVR